MAGSVSTSSSMTSTSHTLTHAAGMSFLPSYTDPSKSVGAAEMFALFEAIKSGNRHGFLQPTPQLPNASLQLAKATLDAYAGLVSDEQQERQKEASKKRKRTANGAARDDVLKIRKLHIDGFESGQIWQQARRIIQSTLQDSKDALESIEELQERIAPQHDASEEAASGLPSEALDIDIGEEEDDDDDDNDDDDEEDSEQLFDHTADFLSEVAEHPEDSELNADEDEDDIADESDEDKEDSDEDELEDGDGGAFIQDPNGLNDAFFSIDEFNKQSQWFEEQDARADPNTDQASDDEELDWHSNPFATNLTTKGANSKGKGEEEDYDELPTGMDSDDDAEDGGPTFGNVDLDAPEGESENEEDGDDLDGGDEDGDFNANEVFYKDFFAPPRRKGSKNGKPAKSKPLKTREEEERDVERAIADVRRDLFDDESEREDSEDALSDVSAGDPKSRRSAHERRQAKLAEEIRKLEAENVAKREWTMSGEAKAIDRPMNSLLEEDLDFEHIGKPVPVITAEVSESIEELIKRRILAQEFDEVIKRRPGVDDAAANTRRGLIELDDAKAKQSLAEIYEEEHVKNTNPDTYMSKSDEKLRKEEQEVEQMWKDVSAKLDGLSSWHYKPKPATPSLTVVSDVATISMEDAQPTTAQGVSGGDTTLAPQEIYKAGKDTAEKGEVVAKSGLPVAKQEMSREDKTKRRRRQKERMRKAGGTGAGKALTGKAKERSDTLGDLKKAGVRVINKKGEIVDMAGNKARAVQAASSGSFKL